MTHKVTYDSHCYYIDDKPIWLVSGAMHYFRVPHQLWEDRIKKAKLGGLNCIETYVAWNHHEFNQGAFDFTGDLDLDRYFTLIEEAGLYIIVRPGPYICSEWDNGAIPAWVTCKPGVTPRVNDPVYLEAVDRWFDKLLPIIAKHQVTRGGGVILVQNENEYLFPDRPGGREYLEHINRKFRSSSIDVPIIVCNHAKLPIEDTVECWNAWDGISSGIAEIRALQPDKPKIITEFWDGWFSYWGMPAGQWDRSPKSVFRRNCEIIGCGATWSYYMWHGGTNFGFNAGRTAPNSTATVTTSYDFGAPVSETGQVTDKYLVTKTANWMAQSWGPFLCKATPVIPSASVEGPFILQELKAEEGSLVVVRTQADDQAETLAKVKLADETTVEVDLSDLDAAILPVGVEGSNQRTVDYSNCTCFCPDMLLFFGPAGSKGIVSINGEKIEFVFPEDDQPASIQTASGEITAMSRSGVERMWYLEDYSVIYGESDFPEVTGLRIDNKATEAPRLGKWETLSISVPDGGWRATGAPKSMDELGHYLGYGWYRCEVESDEDKDISLYFPEAGDRLLVFVNGSYTGTFGRGAGADPHPIKVSLKKGANVITFLADNMGRPNFGRKVGELKGIWGPAGIDWQEVPTPEKTVKSGGIPDEAKDQWELKTLWEPLPEGSRSVIWNIDLNQDESLHLGIYDLPQYAYILVNGRLAYYHVSMGSAFSDLCYNEFDLSEYVTSGTNEVELRIIGWTEETPPNSVTLYKNRKGNTLQGSWSFKPLDYNEAKPGKADSTPLRVHKTTFAKPSEPAPLFLDFSTLGKGQVYLNGKPLGRYWSIGPQTRMYIPEPWVQDENELVIFEEQGHGPEGVRIES